jgi:putative transport protein
MDWLTDIFANPASVESTLLILALVIALGLALGSVSFRGVRLGVAGILFIGLAFGHWGLVPNATVLNFAREFGLVLFVFAVGLSVGPGFFNALRSHGLALNSMALGVVALGALITVIGMVGAAMTGPIAVGLFCGATTNTPSLAAAGQALRDYPPNELAARAALAQVAPDHPLVQLSEPLSDAQREELLAEVTKLPAMAYAVSYPGGVFGIIAAMLLLRWIFRIDPVAEAEQLEEQHRRETPPLANAHVRVTNSNLWGTALKDIPALDSLGVVISRVLRGAEEIVAGPNQQLCSGDILLAVGEPERLQQFVQIVGKRISIDTAEVHSEIHVHWITVSRKKFAERTIGELALNARFGVQVTRIRRSGIELPPLHHVRLHLGDEIRVVGLPEGIAKVAAEMGDSPRQLSEPEFLPVFLGLILGLLLGSIPFVLPGIPGAVKLGIAGGPLLVAIALSRLQRLGPVVWYLPRAANLAMRDIGIALFLASVGLRSGDVFVSAFVEGPGLWWLATGAAITLVPLLIVGFAARMAANEHYSTILGVLAGSMTDPPALAFANSLTKSEIPSVSYATVYPLTMILRILAAQLMMIFWTS